MEIYADPVISNAFLQALADAINIGSVAGKMSVYSGPIPQSGSAINVVNNKLILQFLLKKPCHESISNGVLTFKSFDYALVQSSEPHTFARFTDGNDNFVMDWESGVIDTPLPNGDIAPIQFTSESFSVGSRVYPNTFTVSFA